MRKLISLIAVIFITISCSETKKETIIEKPIVKETQMAASYKSFEAEIEGMTCEIGCARLIESKLSKLNGITHSKVSFETKKGQFTFDENKISKEEIITKINEIAGGDLYKVTKSTDFKEIIEEIK